MVHTLAAAVDHYPSATLKGLPVAWQSFRSPRPVVDRFTYCDALLLVGASPGELGWDVGRLTRAWNGYASGTLTVTNRRRVPRSIPADLWLITGRAEALWDDSTLIDFQALLGSAPSPHHWPDWLRLSRWGPVRIFDPLTWGQWAFSDIESTLAQYRGLPQQSVEQLLSLAYGLALAPRDPQSSEQDLGASALPPPSTVVIGGKRVAPDKAAFIAVEADRRHVVPREARRVSLPSPLPERVQIAGQDVSLETAAAIAEVADQRDTTPAQVLREILAQRAAALLDPPTRARTREEKRRLEGAWMKRGSP